jgi:hypothetical protein
MELLQATPHSLLYATVYPLLWLFPVYRWSRRALRRACVA